MHKRETSILNPICRTVVGGLVVKLEENSRFNSLSLC